MKGFIRILEALMASIILIVSLFYFFGAFVRQSDWDSLAVNTQIRDSIASLDNNGELEAFIYNNDKVGLYNKLKSMLPKNIDFSTIINGMPPPNIYIACHCTDAEYDELK